MTTNEIRCDVEIREATDSPGRITGTILEYGRIAGDRREVFIPGSVQFPQNGIRLLAEHRGRQVMRITPTVEGSAIKVEGLLPDNALGREVAKEIRSGRKRAMSVEFVPHDEQVVQGVREVRGALVDAAAIVAAGAYDQARVEVRHRGELRRGLGRRLWL